MRVSTPNKRFSPSVRRKGGKQAYKPGSVVGSHLSGRKVTFSLKRPYPGALRAASSLPYLALLRTGFAWPAGHPAAGSLLHYLFTLTLDPQPFVGHQEDGHASGDERPGIKGGMFLWHFP